MIVIDGRESTVALSAYSNLEEVLTSLVSGDELEARIVTDVLINDENFSELYPHQTEDISVDEIQRLEVRSVSVEEMAADVVVELPKVVALITGSSQRIAILFRKSELAEALDLLQDMITVGRDFLKTLVVLRERFSSTETSELTAMGESLGELLSEVADAMDSEDWILVADLLEYEFGPLCQGWGAIIDDVSQDIKASQE